MAKQTKGGVRLDPVFISEICLATYLEELDKDGGYLTIGGLDIRERFITNFMKWKKTTDRKKGEAHLLECSKIEQKNVERVLTILTKREQLKSAGKARELKRHGLFNKQYVYNLTVDVYELQQGGREKFIKAHMKQHGSDKERANQRFCDFAQNLAPNVRSILWVLAQHNQLPKGAYA